MSELLRNDYGAYFYQIYIILMYSYTVPYIPNLKEIDPAVPEKRVPETHWIFIFFFFAPNNNVYKLCSCAPISTKFGAQVALLKPCISTKVGTICSKTEENMSDS